MSVQLEAVSWVVDRTPILTDITLAVGDDEAVGIVGASGSGKTSLLRLIAGFERPTTGRITIGGRLASDGARLVPPHARGLGLVAQRPALWPHMTALEHVLFGLSQWDHAEASRRAAEVLRLVRLTGREGRYPRQLSGGEAQRVALARALAPRPTILLLDEPLAGLDPELRDEMVALIGSAREASHATLIHVSHDHNEAAALTRRVVGLAHGRIAFAGDWEQARLLGVVRP